MYEFPILDEKRFRAECEELTADKENDDRFIMYGFGFSMFERAWSIMGMENILCSMITVPEATEKFFEKTGDYFSVQWILHWNMILMVFILEMTGDNSTD